MLVCQSFGLLLGTVVMVPKTAQTVCYVSAQVPCVANCSVSHCEAGYMHSAMLPSVSNP